MWFCCYFEFAERPVSKCTLIELLHLLEWIYCELCMDGSVQCLNVEKMALFVNILDISLSFGTDKWGWAFSRVCGIAHCTWLGFDRKYDDKFIVARPTNAGKMKKKNQFIVADKAAGIATSQILLRYNGAKL